MATSTLAIPVTVVFTTPLMWFPTATIYGSSIGAVIILKADSRVSQSAIKGIIAGLVLAGLLLLALSCWLIWSRLKKDKPKRERKRTSAEDMAKVERKSQRRRRRHGPLYIPEGAAAEEQPRGSRHQEVPPQAHQDMQQAEDDDLNSEFEYEGEAQQQRAR